MTLSGLDFYAHIDRLFNEDPDKFAESPQSLLEAIRNVVPIENLKSSISLSDAHCVRGGSLVRARCMIQDSRGPEMFAFVAELEDGARLATGLFRDAFVNEKFTSFRTLGTRHCYVMTPVPGATEWFLDGFKNDENSISVPSNDSFAETQEKRPHLDSLTVDRFVAKFFDDAAEDLRINQVYDVYGILSEHNLCEEAENGPNETNIAGVPNVHVLHYEPVTEVSTTTGENDVDSVVNLLREPLTAVVGDALTADFLLMHFVSRTYSRPDGQPMCSMPLSITNVRNTNDVVDLVRTLMPKVKLLQVTADLLSNASFVPVKDQESGELKSGELQLSNGTTLIIDEDAFPHGKVTVGGKIEQNLEAFKSLLVDQRLHYDYVFSKVPLDCDIPMMSLSRGPSRFFKTPFILPLPPGEINFSSLTSRGDEWLGRARRALAKTRAALDRISISVETANALKEDFVNVPRRPNEDRAELLNRLLIMSRLVAALHGEATITMDHWRRAKQLDVDRLNVLAEWTKELSQN